MVSTALLIMYVPVHAQGRMHTHFPVILVHISSFPAWHISRRPARFSFEVWSHWKSLNISYIYSSPLLITPVQCQALQYRARDETVF